MDRIFSVRLDEEAINAINVVARALGTSKKAVIGRAIRLLSSQVTRDAMIDPFDATQGAWKRDESPTETADRARATFRDSIYRHRS